MDTDKIISIEDYFSSLKQTDEKFSVYEFLEQAKVDSFLFANPAKRLLKSIGEPRKVDTKNDPVLSRIFSNRVIRVYPAFEEFFGMEDVIESLVSYLRHSEQQLEESKSILYLLGPVGGGKSSLAEKLKELMETQPIYVLGYTHKTEHGDVDELSPLFESPLNLFNNKKMKQTLDSQYGIPSHAIRNNPSPWALQRLKDSDFKLDNFFVKKIYPSILNQVGIAKVEPGDENNQDISTLVGKVDIRKLEKYPQSHPDAYSYSGGLCRASRGILDFVEMFKAPLKMLNPLLTATQEKNFNGTEAIGAMPFDGIILAHSNESEWDQFKSNKTNEAFLDRINLVQVPYCLRYSEEVKIYQKLIKSSKLSNAPVAPGTFEMLAKFTVLSRLHETKLNPNLYTKMEVYNGENLKNTDAKAKSLLEYKADAGVTEGMEGVSTRFAYKILSKVYNANPEDISANPIDLMNILVTEIEKERYAKEKEDKLKDFVTGTLRQKYFEFLEKQLRTAILSSSDEYCQNLYERYILMANDWIEDQDFRDPQTGLQLNVDELNQALTAIEKPGLETNNPKDFRNEVVKFYDKHRANNNGSTPRWNSFSKMRDVIEKKVIRSTEEILPIISFNGNASDENRKKHESFVTKMKELGYTENMIKLVIEWFNHMQKGARS